MVTHPFVEEMGDGTLPPEKFRRYFLQDYVFVKDLVPMIALGAAKAPSIEDGYPLVKSLRRLAPRTTSSSAPSQSLERAKPSIRRQARLLNSGIR